MLLVLLGGLAGGLTAAFPSGTAVHERSAAPAAGAHAVPSTTARHRAKRHWRRGPRGRRGRAGERGPAGAPGPVGAPGPDIAGSLTINWRGLENAPGHDGASAQLPGIGTLTATCNASTQVLSLTPAVAGRRTVLDVTEFQGEGTTGASSNQRLPGESTAPVSVPLPPNGMVSGVISVEPISGNGEPLAHPATFLLSSEWKVNDSEHPSENYCYVAAQLLQGP